MGIMGIMGIMGMMGIYVNLHIFDMVNVKYR
jgi:hypothetical protein